MGLVYRSVLRFPSLSFVIVTSRKLTEMSLISAVNFIVSWKEFKASKKEHNSSWECCQIMNMSSINLHHTSSINLLVDKKSYFHNNFK